MAFGRADVLGSSVAYVRGDPYPRGDTGPTVLFLHGNPTSSFLWRNILSRLTDVADCVALNLIGMGRSGKPRRPSPARSAPGWRALDLGKAYLTN
jgi:pimeloyl-ACP methyl ester carboxylesterase